MTDTRKTSVFFTLLFIVLLSCLLFLSMHRFSRHISMVTNIQLSASVYPWPSDGRKMERKNITVRLSYPTPEFLPNYRNPCWIERSPFVVTNYSASIRAPTTLTQLPDNTLVCLPYFFIAGFTKCGTTDIHSKLLPHPDLVPPRKKEPHYFRNSLYGALTLGDYTKFFSEAAQTISRSTTEGRGAGAAHQSYHPKITWDASASTAWFNNYWKLDVNNRNVTSPEPEVVSADHVHHLLPRVKLIFMIRNPTDRLYSDFLFVMRRHLPVSPATEFHSITTAAVAWFRACREERGCSRACVYSFIEENKRWGWRWRRHSWLCLAIGLYSEHLTEWLRVFPPNQLLLVRLEDYAANRTQQLLRVVDFLGISQPTRELHQFWESDTVENKNQRQDVELMFPETRRLLDEFYQPYLNKLADMFNDTKWSYRDI